METSAFDFDLPAGLIAQHPTERRDGSRLMVVRRADRRIEHRVFADLPELLEPGDILVRNNSRVVPARLVGHRVATGGRWEGLFLHTLPGGDWEILATTRGKPEPGERVEVEPPGPDVRGPVTTLGLTLLEKRDGGRWVVRPEPAGPVGLLLDRFGRVPLPPYIRKGHEGPGDRVRYQTVYAEEPGSVAAPTAGLHFTDDLFRRLEARGVATADVTLHVGVGTFRPIETDLIEDHVMHAERGGISPETADRLNARRAEGGRLVAVGTTSARLIETAARASGTPSGRIAPFSGDTAIYLRPGHDFLGVDALLTNFHLPRSSLIVLVSALAGVDLTRQAYAEAVRLGYRFYSYGDAMLVL